MRQHGTPTAVIGLVQAAIVAGGLFGALVAPRLQRRVRLGTLAAANPGIAVRVLGVGQVLLVVVPPRWLAPGPR